MTGTFGVSCCDVPSFVFIPKEPRSSCFLGDSSIRMGVLLVVCGFPYLILVLLLVLK